MRAIEQFTRIAPISKTIRNRLIPCGKTKEYIIQERIIETDQEKASFYKDGKLILDNVYKDFIEKSLKGFGCDYDNYKSEDYIELAETLDKFHKDKINNYLDLRNKQAKCRQAIVKHMGKTEFFEIFQKGKSKEILDYAFESSSSELRETLKKEFKGFSGYFNGYCNSRANMFKSTDDSVAIAYRIINDNFSKFCCNIRAFNKIKEIPELLNIIIIKAKEDLGIENVEESFSVENYPIFITQSGINNYNRIFSGFTTGSQTKKAQGINELINQYIQQNQQIITTKKRELLMTPLFKQILSDRESSSFVINQYSTETEMLLSINQYSSLFDKILKTSERISHLMDFDIENIYINSKLVSEISLYCFGRWDALLSGYREYRLNLLQGNTTKKTLAEIEKQIKSSSFSIADILNAEGYCVKTDGNKSIIEYFTKEFPSMVSSCIEKKKNFENIVNDLKGNRFKESAENITVLKNYMDSLLSLTQVFRSFLIGFEYEIDVEFYDLIFDNENYFRELAVIYDMTRNFITKKGSQEQKIKLNFNCPTLANGWDKNKENDNLCVIFRKENQYFLGIINKNNKTEISSKTQPCIGNSDCYEKMIYKYLPSPSKMLPKVMFPKSGKYSIKPSKSLISCIEKKREKKTDYFLPEFKSQYEFEIALIDFYQKSIPLYGDWSEFKMQFKKADAYDSLNDFYSDVEDQNYFIKFEKLSAQGIEKLVEDGKLFLFQIYNKDYAKGSTGKKNLHTIYWESLFSEKNIVDKVIKLNGEAELFYRAASRNDKCSETHPLGSYVVNRITKDGQHLPDSIHSEIFKFANGYNAKLSEEARLYYEKTVIKKVDKVALTKDKRFHENQFFFHVPITFNPKAREGDKLNILVNKKLKADDSCRVIGIDRGERNLLYISVIDDKGKILLQKSLNDIFPKSNNSLYGVNYHEKLIDAEKTRDKARKSWSSIGKIKDLKEGYLSQVVSVITELMIKYNAVVILEDLNFGFKRGRFKVERQVYQKFESALISKLNLLVFKDREPLQPGGVLNGLQLTNPFESFEKIGKQTGWLFYVPAAYTSKIDPITGFSNLFITKDLTNLAKKKEFFAKFKSISFCSSENAFHFTFDYNDFLCHTKQNKGSIWEISTREERIIYKDKQYKKIQPTEMLRDAFKENLISFDAGQNILPEILSMDSIKLFDSVYKGFAYTLQMRNSSEDEDYIISPVKNAFGEYYDSRNYKPSDQFPCDADANGAYNIARKGLIFLKRIKESDDGKPNLRITDDEWFEFVKD